MSRRRPGLHAGTAALLAVTSVGLTGCGRDATSAADEVPRLATILQTVDDAIVDGRYLVARRKLDSLVELTVASRDSGELDGGRAEDVLAAAAQLLAMLPEPRPRPDPKPSSTQSPTTMPTTAPPDVGGRNTGGRGGRDGGGDKADGPGKRKGGKGKGGGKGRGRGGKGRGR